MMESSAFHPYYIYTLAFSRAGATTTNNLTYYPQKNFLYCIKVVLMSCALL